MALSRGRNTIQLADNQTLILPVKANTKIFDGGIVMVDGGYAVPGKKATGLLPAGRAEEYVDNTGTGGTNGAVMIKVVRGVFRYDNDTTNPITEGDLLKDCYVLDDETVTMLNSGTSKAGKVLGIDGDEVIVEIM